MIMGPESLNVAPRSQKEMVAPVIQRIRTANLPQFQLSPKETVFLVSLAALGNLLLGFAIGFFL